MQIGVLYNYWGEESLKEIKNIHDLGFKQCQLSAWKPDAWTDAHALKLKNELDKYEIEVSTFWCGWGGPVDWDFCESFTTVGLVPEKYRAMRLQQLKDGADFAKKIGVCNVATHIGFVPENPHDHNYTALVDVMKELALHCKNNGQYFLFETGQETPMTLERLICDIGTGNLGVNIDPANLVTYGKANPVDSLLILGKYIRDVHAKDGCYPTNPYEWGPDMPLGMGDVKFPLFVKRLKEIGYDGPVTIECEFSSFSGAKDILDARDYIRNLWYNE